MSNFNKILIKLIDNQPLTLQDYSIRVNKNEKINVLWVTHLKHVCPWNGTVYLLFPAKGFINNFKEEQIHCNLDDIIVLFSKWKNCLDSEIN